MTYDIILEESYQPEFGRPYQSEQVVRTGLDKEEARRYALVCNTKAFSNQYYSTRPTPTK